MKGFFFTKFLELVEENYGLEMVRKITNEATLKSQGIFDPLGTYSNSEMAQLLQCLSKNTGVSINNLLLIYEKYFFTDIEKKYQSLIATSAVPNQMISRIEDNIQTMVKEIYPDVELPFLKINKKTDKEPIIKLKFRKPPYFRLDLMNKTFKYFNLKASLVQQKVKADNQEFKFTIHKN
jgi:hypothetical protein